MMWPVSSGISSCDVAKILQHQFSFAGQRRKVGPAAADEILSADAPCFISQVPMVLLQTWIYFRFVKTKLSETQLEPHFLEEFVGEGLTQAMASRYWKLNLNILIYIIDFCSLRVM